MASKTKRVGIFSIARYQLEGIKSIEKIAYNCCKVMIHEMSHMFGLKHCVFHKCVMNGAMYADEENKKPMCILQQKIKNRLLFDLREKNAKRVKI